MGFHAIPPRKAIFFPPSSKHPATMQRGSYLSQVMWLSHGEHVERRFHRSNIGKGEAALKSTS